MVTVANYQAYLMQIQQFVALRLHVALRLRIGYKRDPIESYYLAHRLLAMGFANLLPIPLDEIRYQAAAHHIADNLLSTDKVDKLVCVGDIPERFFTMLTEMSKLPIEARRKL